MVKIDIGKEKELYMDQTLMYQLDTLVYNVKNDWDFVIIITGDRMVRTGKSVLGLQIGSYLAHRLGTRFDIENIHFESKDMIDFAQDAPKNTVIMYDEARESLAATKTAKKIQKDILDYFAECGQLNHIFIVILPDFFELKENMAVARSEYLINVWRSPENKLLDYYRDGEKRPLVYFKRGNFEFYSRKRKSILYDVCKAKHQKNYQLVKPNFKGRFVGHYPIDEDMYKNQKLEALKRYKDKKEEEKVTPLKKIALKIYKEEKSTRKTAEKLYNEVSHNTIARWSRELGSVM